MACDVFLSYTTIKNMFDKAVTHFREHLEVELYKKTGHPVIVFQDERDIHGGDKWKEILIAEIDSAKLLLVLLSPTWLQSKWCRKEYKRFVEPTDLRLRGRPIDPLTWDKVAGDELVNAPEAATILSQLREHQIIQWGDLQYEKWESPELKKAASRLAEEIKLKLRKHGPA